MRPCPLAVKAHLAIHCGATEESIEDVVRAAILQAMRVLPLNLLVAACAIAVAQSPSPVPANAIEMWQMQDSGTIAGLRGIDSVDGTVAWASGTGGTVLRTLDGGQHWQKCAIPDGDRDGASLDFRGVQAFDANAAFIMSSGKGRLSRLYKTKDGCKTWKLIFVNPDKDGFWDAIYFGRRHEESNNGKIPWWLDGWLLGDPVQGRFSVFSTANSGVDWFKQKNKGVEAEPATQGAFAASNSSLITFGGAPLFGSGGSGGGFVFDVKYLMTCLDCTVDQAVADRQGDRWDRTAVPVGHHSESSGVFSVAFRSQPRPPYSEDKVLVAVGGDYSNPNDSSNTAAFKLAHDQHWTASTTPPHGYRSTVQWSESLRLWITAGTNGSDISRDDGRTWQPLDDGNWNALSLPFIVGPNGRIARLNPASLAPGN